MASSQQAPRPPLQMPPQPSWSQNMGSSQFVPSPAQSWGQPMGAAMGNAQSAPVQHLHAQQTPQTPQTPQPPSTAQWSYSNTEFSQLQAPPLVGTPPASLSPSYDDDRPMLFSAQSGKNFRHIRKVLTIVVISLLVLVILAASVTLLLVLTQHHIGSGVLPIIVGDT